MAELTELSQRQLSCFEETDFVLRRGGTVATIDDYSL